MINTFILDVDGVLTNGKFLYSSEGKVMKEFGADDADALKLLSKHGIKIIFTSQDKRGMSITKKRITDMGFELFEVKSRDRAKFIEDNYGLDNSIYMGDSFVDIPTFKVCKYSICPCNSSDYLKPYASYVTKTNGGERAVAEAVFWIVLNILNISIDEFLES